MARQPKRITSGRKNQVVRAAAGAAVRPIESLEGRLLFAVFTWDGGGNNNNWTTPQNWVGDVAPLGDGTDQLLFGSTGASRQTNTNDYPAGTVFKDIDFSSGGWTIDGNAVTVDDDIDSLATSGTNTVNLEVTFVTSELTFSSLVSGGSTLIVNGPIHNQDNELRLRGVSAVTVNSPIDGSGLISKDATAIGTLTNDNAYTGGTLVRNGNLVLNHTGAGSATGTGAVTVDGVLRGVGRAAGPVSISNGGSLFPGVTSNSAGVLQTGDLSFAANSRYGASLNGNTAGSEYDQVRVTGTVDIVSGARLEITPASGFVPATGVVYSIIDNDGAADPVTGNFSVMENNTPRVLEEGGRVSVGGQTYQISYIGGDGNDVVLTTVEANDPPLNEVPGNQTTFEDVALVFTGPNQIQVSDPDAGSDAVRTTLAATNGTVTLAGTTNLTVTAGANGTDTVTVEGAIADINVALASVTYTPAAAFSGAATLTVTTNDLGHNGPGNTPEEDIDVININVNDASSQPPSAVDDVVNREVGQQLTINVLANDTDPLGRPMTISIATTPASGTAVVNSDNTISYTAAPGFNGDDVFTYQLSNGETTDTGTVTITATGTGLDQDPGNPSLQALFINGTPGSDNIKISKRKGGGVRVRFGKTEVFSSATIPTGSVVINAGAGDDIIKPGFLKNVPFRVYGGDGNDRISTGTTADIVVGGIGNDIIKTGKGNDLVIGGGDSDNIAAAAGDDIVISSSTAYNAYTDENSTALRDLLATWNNGADYGARVTAIQSGVGSLAAKLDSSTVSSDNPIDKLNGAGGDDLYFSQSNDKVKPKGIETNVVI